MQADDDLHTFSLDLGASAALSNGQRIDLPVNLPWREMHRVYLTAVASTNASAPDVCISIEAGCPLATIESSVAGARQYRQDGLFILVPVANAQAEVQRLGIGQCWLYSRGTHQQGRVEVLRLRVTTWGGTNITYDDLKLQFAYSRTPTRHLEATSRAVQDGMDHFRNAGRV